MPAAPAQPAATLDRLGSTPDGLSTAEATSRLSRYGANALADKRVSSLRRLVGCFSGPIAWMIAAAAPLSAVVGHWDDFTFIVLLRLFNAAVGFCEEFQADTAVANCVTGP